ncbi:hypothetical protein N9M90_03680, partial [Alphaproteobacteria bacterium]|nr:hypothetical protein [Alphaproteobacteria bacterium]
FLIGLYKEFDTFLFSLYDFSSEIGSYRVSSRLIELLVVIEGFIIIASRSFFSNYFHDKNLLAINSLLNFINLFVVIIVTVFLCVTVIFNSEIVSFMFNDNGFRQDFFFSKLLFVVSGLLLGPVISLVYAISNSYFIIFSYVLSILVAFILSYPLTFYFGSMGILFSWGIGFFISRLVLYIYLLKVFNINALRMSLKPLVNLIK